MVARIEVEQSVACGHIDSIVCCKFCQRKLLTPARKTPFDIQPQKVLHCLNHPLRLTIDLQMKCCTELGTVLSKSNNDFQNLPVKRGS